MHHCADSQQPTKSSSFLTSSRALHGQTKAKCNICLPKQHWQQCLAMPQWWLSIMYTQSRSFLPGSFPNAHHTCHASMGKAWHRSDMSSRLIKLRMSLSTVRVCESVRQKPLTHLLLPPIVELLPTLCLFRTPVSQLVILNTSSA